MDQPESLSAWLDALPAVGGRRIDCSIATFERRALLALKEEQEKTAPDNALIAVLCDAVRLGREYCDAMKERISASNVVLSDRPARGSANFASIVEEAFKKHREQVGDHWSWEWAIRESDAEDFAREIVERISSPNGMISDRP